MNKFFNTLIKKKHEFFFKLRYFLIMLIINSIQLRKKNSSFMKELSFSFNEFSKNGFVKLRSFYSNNEVKYLNIISNQILNDTILKKKLKDNDTRLEQIDGSIKIKQILDDYKELGRFTNGALLQIFSLLFNCKIMRPEVILNISHDGSYNQSLIPGICSKNIADHPHIDVKEGYKRYLKAFVILEDLTNDNGPTQIIPNSSDNKKIIKYLNISNGSNKLKETIDKISNNSNEVSLTGKKGDLVIFDSRNIHWAGILKKGIRKLLWIYF